MTIEERTRQQYAKVLKDWQIEGGMIGRGSQGKTAVFKITKENSGFTETGALKIINLYETALTGNNDPLDEIEKEILLVRKSAENELAAMNRMKGHGNIVSYHEFAFEEYKSESVRGVDLLIRMDFLENIGSKIREGVIFSETEIIRMGKDLSRALADCHKKGILHRDIKPDNIFMNEYGYLLGDFGIAKYSEENNLVANTMAGSYPYAAPEQMKYTGTGNKEGIYDYRVDIYALGLSLYELANNDRIPFATSTYKRAEDIQRRLNGETLPGLSSVSKELETVILKACTYKPEDRFQTALDMLRAFENLSLAGSSQKPIPQEITNMDSLDETLMAVGGYQAPAEKEEPARADDKRKETMIIPVISVGIIVVIALVIVAGIKKNTPVPVPETVGSSENTDETVMEDIKDEAVEEVAAVEADDVSTEETEASGQQDTADLGKKTEFAGTLRADPFEGTHDEKKEMLKEKPVFGDDNFRRRKIKSISFFSTVPEDKDEPGYDVSEEKDGSILAWFDKSGGDYYNLIIAADGKILLPEDCSCLFGGYSNVESISFGNCVDTSKVKKMDYMFSGCDKLEFIEGLEYFDTSSVTDMSSMFLDDASLSTLDLTSFDTKKVENFFCMFFGCIKLSELNISSFNTEKAEDMSYLFWSCYGLEKLDISSFQTSNVETMDSMFAGCKNLIQLDVSKLNTDKVVDMKYMFDGCFRLEGIDVSKFNTALVKNMDYTFRNCKQFQELDLSAWDFSSLESAQDMIDGCSDDLKFYADKQKSGFNNLEKNKFPVPILQRTEM